MRDHYLVLGLKPNANADMITKAYNDLSRAYHTSVYRGSPQEAQELASEVKHAYSVLSNYNSKKEYDNSKLFRIRTPLGFGQELSVDALTSTGPNHGVGEYKPSFWQSVKDLFTGRKPKPRNTAKAEGLFSVVMGMIGQPQLYRECRKQLIQAVEADPYILELHYDLAIMCYKVGEYEQARHELKECLSIDHTDKLSRKFLSML
ncbi:MAG: DnaJ domain-containing protein [bacterium]|nr:DnaJ domain-containing protein [bacterium]